MAGIIDLHKPVNGDETFLLCPCTAEGSALVPVVIHDPKGPIVAGLLCVECEISIPVVNGIVQLEEE